MASFRGSCRGRGDGGGCCVLPPAKVSTLFLTADMSLIEDWAARARPVDRSSGRGAGAAFAGPDREPQAQTAGPAADAKHPGYRRGEHGAGPPLRRDRGFSAARQPSGSDRQIGALGITHDWRISRRIVDLVRTPVILAGGLGPDNVAEAIRAVRPAGVDSKTRTDRPGPHAPKTGAKDLDRVRRFHEAAQAGAASLS